MRENIEFLCKSVGFCDCSVLSKEQALLQNPISAVLRTTSRTPKEPSQEFLNKTIIA